uniref:Putative portal protein n=1 Tax=viral metagenome TaxID=1070528 RepID=A0A6M3JRC2_9ZZZZ
MAEAIKLSQRRHPLFTENEGKWSTYLNSVLGGASVLNADYIFSHRLEDAVDHADRILRAYYLNFCDTIPSIYNSYIFREHVERPSDKILELFRINTDGRTTPIYEFVKRAGYWSSVYGVVHALVDITPTAKKNVTKRDVKTGEVAPYATLVFPSQLVDWSIDAWGDWRWVVIATTYYRDEDPGIEREEETHYRIITTEEWRVEDQDGQPVDFPDIESKGPNELGIVPLATMYHRNQNDDKVGESLIKDIAFINRTILNWCSCIDEQIDRQTFSQLVVPDDGTLAERSESGEDPLVKIGTGTLFTFPYEASQPPQFISPNTENIKTIWALVADHIKEIFRISGLVGGTGDLYASKSGRAAQVGFQGVNSALAEKAASYQKFENDISKLAYIQLGKDPSALELVKYPTSFDISALSDDIDSYFKVMERNISETLNKTIMKTIARRAAPLVSQTIKAQIETEIESGSGVIETVMRQKTNNVGEDGNPNVNNLSDTHRTTQDKEFDEKTKQKKTE